MSTGQNPVLFFLGGDRMNVTIPEITDKEIADTLKRSGMTDEQVKSFLERCASGCCAEKVRTLRNVRKSLLDTIHEEQAVLDRLDYLIWCTERNKQ